MNHTVSWRKHFSSCNCRLVVPTKKTNWQSTLRYEAREGRVIVGFITSITSMFQRRQTWNLWTACRSRRKDHPELWEPRRHRFGRHERNMDPACCRDECRLDPWSGSAHPQGPRSRAMHSQALNNKTTATMIWSSNRPQATPKQA